MSFLRRVTVRQIGISHLVAFFPPLAAPTLLEGWIPCIAHGDEQKVSINFY